MAGPNRLELTVVLTFAAGAAWVTFQRLDQQPQAEAIVVQPVIHVPLAPPTVEIAAPAPPTVELNVEARNPEPGPAAEATESWEQPEALGPCRPLSSHGDQPGDLEAATPEPTYFGSTSPWDPRLRAAWGDGRAFVSVDGGATWTIQFEPTSAQQLALGEAPNHVHDMGFDCHGRAFAVRAGGYLGMVDPGQASRDAVWTKVSFLHGRETAALAIDRGRVGVLIDDPLDPGGLLLVQRDDHDRWTTREFWREGDNGSWDGVSVVSLEHLSRDRFRAHVVPWQGGECGYEEHYRLSFSLDGPARSRRIDELSQ